jgi:hypothetical protein
MNRKRRWMVLLLSVISMGLSNLTFADQQTLTATMSWNAEGDIYVVSSDELQFQGAIEGIFYVEKASGKLNAAFGLCPVVYIANTKEKTISGSGRCEIIGDKGDSIFAEYSCSGQAGFCKGKFNITGGTGSLTGAKGSSELIMRSVINALVYGLGSGSHLVVKNGILILPKLTYSVPEK